MLSHWPHAAELNIAVGRKRITKGARIFIILGGLKCETSLYTPMARIISMIRARSLMTDRLSGITKLIKPIRYR
jgi:hypothetical protein